MLNRLSSPLMAAVATTCLLALSACSKDEAASSATPAAPPTGMAAPAVAHTPEVPAPPAANPPPAAAEQAEQAASVTAPNESASSTPAAPSHSALRAWQGEWFGVEGLYLKLTAKPDAKYEIYLENMDGKYTFEGTEGPNHIAFERNGIQEKITASDGEGTGLKWLDGKNNCLVIKEGEGFCRD